MLDGSVVVSVLLPSGSNATKAIPLDSPDVRMAVPALQVDAPLSTMGLSGSAPSYHVGDEVQVWSNSFCSWCDGKVLAVEGKLLKTEFFLPNGSAARKSLVASQGGLRRQPKATGIGGGSPRVPKMSEDDIEMDYHGELGLMNLYGQAQDGQEPYAVGDDVEVWSNSNKAWCPGKVVAVEEGLATTNFTLPSGAVAKKTQTVDDENLRAMVRSKP